MSTLDDFYLCVADDVDVSPFSICVSTLFSLLNIIIA